MADKKMYFHRTPGAKFHLQHPELAGQVREICFAGGYFETDDEQAIKELDKVANIPASQIYTVEKPLADPAEAAVKKEVMSQATNAFDQAHKITGPAETVPLPTAQAEVSAVTPSAVAASLEAAKAAVASAGKKQ